jgi:hypothetical protein
MRHFMIAIAAVSMLGLGAAQAAQPTMKGHQPGAREHMQPTAHRVLAEGEQLGAQHPAKYAEGEALNANHKAQFAEGEELNANHAAKYAEGEELNANHTAKFA